MAYETTSNEINESLVSPKILFSSGQQLPVYQAQIDSSQGVIENQKPNSSILVRDSDQKNCNEAVNNGQMINEMSYI